MNILSAINKALAKEPVNPHEGLYRWLKGMDPAADVEQTMPTEVATWRAAQAEWAKAFQATSRFTEEQAKQRFVRELSDGRDHLTDATRTRGLHSLITEYEAKMEVAKSAMRNASFKAKTTADAIYTHLETIADRLLSERLAAEAKEAAELGLEPTQSALTVALKEFSNTIKLNRQRPAGGKPSDMIRFLDSKGTR